MVRVNPYFQIHDLNKQYKKTTILRNLSLSAEKGERVALLGPSGVGKTTLLKIIAGLLVADSGHIVVNGEKLDALPAEKRNIGMMFQNFLLFPFLSVQQNIEFGLKMAKHPSDIRKKETKRVLRLLQLEHLSHRMPHELSSGQQQRTVLARAIVLQPQVLLLDEPFANLDPHLRYESQEVLLRLYEEFHPTILMVSHSVSDVLFFAQKVGILLDGKIAQYDTPRMVYEKPVSQQVARIFGNINALQARREEKGFRIQEGTMIHAPEILHRHQEGEDLVLTCHPEQCQIHRQLQPDRKNFFPAVVSRSFYIGHRRRYQLSTDAGEWQVITTHKFSEGDRVYLHLPEKKLWSMQYEPDII